MSRIYFHQTVLSASFAFVMCFLVVGCSGGTQVEGRPALKLPEGTKPDPGVVGMGMDPVAHRLLTLDKNKNDQIDPDEIPPGGLPDYDLNEDGTITKEELTKWVERKRIEGEAKRKARLAKKKQDSEKQEKESDKSEDQSGNEKKEKSAAK